jgi:hypothetical protein
MFNEGELVYAEMNDMSGKEAFYSALALRHGRFKFTQGLTPSQKNKDVIGGFMALIMEGMKHLDDSEG